MPWPPEGDPMEEVDFRTFWEDRCYRYVRSVTFMLWAANKEATLDHIWMFVDDAPRHPEDLMDEQWRKSYCSLIMERAHVNCKDAKMKKEWQDAFDFIAGYIPRCGLSTAEMMIQGIRGTAGALSARHDPPRPPRRFFWFWR
jgi:hypothetical protein